MDKPLPPVLYAEDDWNDVFFMRHAWEQAGIPNPLMIVEDGQQVIEYLAGQGPFADREKHPLPCLLLLDLKLPVKSGLEVLQWLRENPALQSLTVVVVSASAQESDLAMTQKLRISDYVVKPSLPTALVDILRKGKELWLAPEGNPPG